MSTGCGTGGRAPSDDGNLEFRPRSSDHFVEDLRTARGVVAGGGFSLLSEAVFLGKPILSIPLRGQFEQLLNARYVASLGYGICARATLDVARDFIERIPEFEDALAGYRQRPGTRSRSTRSRSAIEAGAATWPELRRARREARRASR